MTAKCWSMAWTYYSTRPDKRQSLVRKAVRVRLVYLWYGRLTECELTRWRVAMQHRPRHNRGDRATDRCAAKGWLAELWGCDALVGGACQGGRGCGCELCQLCQLCQLCTLPEGVRTLPGGVGQKVWQSWQSGRVGRGRAVGGQVCQECQECHCARAA